MSKMDYQTKLERLQSKIQALGTELERQNKVIADEYKYRCGLVGKLQSVEAENKKLQEQEEMSNGCFIMIAEALEKVGCCHGHDAKSTPPMFYDDMIYCAVAKREKQIKTLQADLGKVKEALNGNNNLKIAISKLLFSYNRHWIRMSWDGRSRTSPSEVAESVVFAEQALESEGKKKRSNENSPKCYGQYGDDKTYCRFCSLRQSCGKVKTTADSEAQDEEGRADK